MISKSWPSDEKLHIKMWQYDKSLFCGINEAKTLWDWKLSSVYDDFRLGFWQNSYKNWPVDNLSDLENIQWKDP